MIFITLGSQQLQFNRLLKAVDQQVAEGKIKDKVFAQIGYSDYIPQNYEYKAFLDREEFMEMQKKSDLIITHGGTGAIVGALKKDRAESMDERDRSLMGRAAVLPGMMRPLQEQA